MIISDNTIVSITVICKTSVEFYNKAELCVNLKTAQLCPWH